MPVEAEVPPTRQHIAAELPPSRPSGLSLDPIQKFPDDSSLSGGLRKIDHYLGLIEQGLLVAILAAVVLVAAASALSDRLAHHHLGLWWTFVVRKGTFAIAMLGAAFATQQQRLLAMDLVSKRLPPRGRLVLGVVLKLFTIAIAGVLYHIGWYLHGQGVSAGEGPHLDLGFMTLTEQDVVSVIPIGALLIIVHCILHAVIDIDYLARNKLPPERMRSGH